MKSIITDEEVTINMTHDEYVGLVGELTDLAELIKYQRKGKVLTTSRPGGKLLVELSRSLNLSLFED